MGEVVPDEFAVRADGGEQRALRVTLVQVRVEIIQVLLTVVFAANVVHAARQLQIGHEQITVVFSSRPLELEKVIEHVNLEGRLSGAERPGELPQSIQVVELLLPVLPEIHVVGGNQFHEIHPDEIGVVTHFGFPVDQLLELFAGHPAVDAEAAEATAVAPVQVFVDELDQTGNVGLIQVGEEIVTALRLQSVHVLREPAMAECRESVQRITAGSVQRTLKKTLSRNKVLVEFGGIITFFPGRPPLVIEMKV